MINFNNHSSQQPSVLVVDDDDTARTMAMGFLSQSGFNVTEAASGEAALEMVVELHPDLIILDVEMPGLNGFEVCSALRLMPAFLHTPILMLTGLDNNEYIDKAYVAGATDFASKPINWSLLGHRLRYMHRTSLAAEQLLSEQASLADAQRIALLGSWKYDVLSDTLVCSDQLYRIVGLEPGERAPNPKEMLSFVHREDKNAVNQWISQSRQSSQAAFIDHKLKLSDGTIKSVRQQLEVDVNTEGEVVALKAVVQDFTEKRLVEEKVHQLAYYDTLTLLPNRILFQEKLELAMERANESGGHLAVLYFDLDNFKRVNDTFGHAVGDKLLHEVAERLTQSLDIPKEGKLSDRSLSTIARMGGDEFIIVLDQIQDSTDAETAAEKIISVVGQSYHIDDFELFTSPSIGIAVFPNDGANADALLKNADMAMYEAKRTGKNVYITHSEEMQVQAVKRYNIDKQMRAAITNNEFSINYQVQTDLSTGRIYSAEALARWNSDTLGFVSPADFIPVSEENGLIVAIGEWILRKSCQQARQWLDNDFPVPSVAVNISVMQFMRSDFPSVVADILAETNLPAENLELEITESLLASDIHFAIETLKKLHDIGVKLSIDDFGTGYSSLSQLKHFPIDRLKIDQSFIRNIPENQNDMAITNAVIAMSKSMGIKVLAEGVETEEQFNFLREQGCDEVQGYLISKPVSAEQLELDMPELLSNLARIYNSGQENIFKKAS